MLEEALAIANVILKLKAMDASLTDYISAAENTSDLIQRLLLAQNAISKDFGFQKVVEESAVQEAAIYDTTLRINKCVGGESESLESDCREESLPRKPKARGSSRSSVYLIPSP
jgi:hypothetical protein